MLKKWSILASATLLTAGLAACSGQTNSTSSGQTDTKQQSTPSSTSNNDSVKEQPKEKVKLVFWNTNYRTLDDNDKTKKKEDFYIYQAVQRFEKTHPNITVDVQTIKGGPESFTKFKTASIAKNGPDINTIWSGSYLYAMKQYIEPLDTYLKNDPVLNDVVGWETVKEDGKGQILGVPAGNDGIMALYYNKDLLAKAGLDYEKQPPKNAVEWLAGLDQLKKSGLAQPLAFSPDNFWFHPAYWIAQTVGKDGVYELATGKRKFTDPAIKEILSTYMEFSKRQFVTTDQASQLFTQSKAAMTIGGAWLIPDLKKAMGDKLGMIKVPDFSEKVPLPSAGLGQVGSAFLVTNYSKHKQEAVEFLKFLVSKEEQEQLLKSGESSLSVNKTVSYDQIIKDPLFITMQKWATEPNVLPYLDNTLPAEVADEVSKISPVLLKGQLSPDDFMKQIDQKIQEALTKSK